MSGNGHPDNMLGALDAELESADVHVPDVEWREKVAIAKEAREFGRDVRRNSAPATQHSLFRP